MKNQIQKYKDNNIVIFSVIITQKEHNSGKWKKNIIYPPKWNEFTLNKTYTNDKYNGLAMLTGEINNVVVLDIDNLDHWEKLLQEKNQKEPNTVKAISGSGGLHYYFKYDNEIQNIKTSDHCFGKDYDIDIRTNGGCIIIPPTTYHNNNLNKEVEYKWEKNIFDHEIKKIPKWIKNLLHTKNEINKEINKNTEKEINKKSITKKKILESDSDGSNSDSDEDTNSSVDSNNNDVIQNGKSIKCTNYNLASKEIQNVKNNKNNMFNYFSHAFEYSNKKFEYIIKNINGENVPFFKGMDVADFFEYTDTDHSICDHVDEDDKFKLMDLLGPAKLTCLTYDEKNTIYISEPGIYSLIWKSKKPEAKDFKKFVKTELMPSLRKTGSYSIKGIPKKINSFINEFIKDTSQIENFYNKNNIIAFFHANVFYLIVVGMIDGCYIIKFGHSMRIFERDYNEHKKTFGEQSKVIFVAETDNNILVETQFKKFLETKNALFEMKFERKNRIELFKTSQNLSIEDAIEAAEMLIEKNPSNAEKKIKEYNKFELSLSTKLEIAKEKTKQIELQEQTKQKQIELQEQTKQKQIELQEQTKQIELQAKQKQTELDIIDKSKNEKNGNNDIYLQFLNECTEENKEGHIHCSSLYVRFKVWFKTNNSQMTIPTNREFIASIKKYKDIQRVRVGDTVMIGIKNLKTMHKHIF
jgi:prophage antirepressor-like protein